MTSFSLSVMQNQLATIIPVFELKACNGLDLYSFMNYFETSDEMKLMDRVVQCILKRGEREPFNVVKYPTGLDEMLDDLETTLLLQQQQSRKTQFVWIVDLGGVGKTTFLKELIIHKLLD